MSDSRFWRNSCSCSAYQAPPVGSKENNLRNTQKMQSGNQQLLRTLAVWRSLLPSPPSLQGGLSRTGLSRASQGQAAGCSEQQECDRAAEKEPLVAQTKQLVLPHWDGSTPLPADTSVCLALGETATLRALWQYHHDCTWKQTHKESINEVMFHPWDHTCPPSPPARGQATPDLSGTQRLLISFQKSSGSFPGTQNKLSQICDAWTPLQRCQSSTGSTSLNPTGSWKHACECPGP